MFESLKEIKALRKKVGLTQSQLAKMAGVSQSLIAKIESESLDPTYNNAVRIFEALSGFSHKKTKTASELMNKKIISVSPDSDVKDAVKKMKKFEISQMPILDDGKVVGRVSETNVLDAIIGGRSDSKIEDIMNDSPPIVSPNTSSEVISSLLHHFSMILVEERGKIKGLITKSDFINKTMSKV